MPNTLRRYPNSTPSGDAIPLDVLWPLGTFKKTIASATGYNSIAIEPCDFLYLQATAACYLRIGGTFSAAPTDNAYTSGVLYIPADPPYPFLIYPDDATILSLWGLGSGDVFITFLKAWQETRSSAQFSRV